MDQRAGLTEELLEEPVADAGESALAGAPPMPLELLFTTVRPPTGALTADSTR